MFIKIEHKFTDDIKELRQKSYSEYDYNGIDEIDKSLGPNHKWYINCYNKKGDLIGSSRLVRKHMPFKLHFGEVETAHNDFELGRLCIDDNFGPTEKMNILTKIAKTVIGICLAQNCSKLFASAKCPNNFIYKRLAGFEQISKPQAYPPFTKGIYLLALDFQKEYNNRKKKLFDLTEEFVNSIKNQLTEVAMAA